MRCRICRTARNLKYTSKELLRLQKDKSKKKLRLPLSAIPQTTGNICIDCDERLQNFHRIDDESDVVDVDSNGFSQINKLSVERSLIVNSNERLLDVLYTKNANHQSNEGGISTKPTHSLGSDGDAEVIDLLTSRETTPDKTDGYMDSNIIDYSNAIPTRPTIIDVIDLEEYDETDKDLNKQSANLTKETAETEKQTRILGCLNLVSSDSESEINFEPCPREEVMPKNVEKTPVDVNAEQNFNTGMLNGAVECTVNNNNNLNCKDFSVTTIKHSLHVCRICGISCMDKHSLEAHIRNEHEGYNCRVCKCHYPKPLDLVNHMRQKHRSYDGEDLCEGARCSQDSAMTIRLRFMQRFTFYECQLCGLIESQFKAHKSHIIQKHADESKSLRDPMMKAHLKCPSCHQNCGSHPVDICRHLFSKHDPEDGRKYVTEVTDLKAIGLSDKYLQNLQHATKFYKLISHNQIFFECQMCRKVLSSKNNISRHFNGHNIDDWKRLEAIKTEGNLSPIESKRKLKRKIAYKSDSEPLERISKKEPPPKKIKLECEIPLKAKKNNPPKDIKLTITEKTTKAKKLPPLAASIPLNTVTVKNNNRTSSPNISKRQKKLKHKLDKISKNKKVEAAITKVKVKPPLRHFPTQKYSCKYCHLLFKGYRKLQLHLLNLHRSEEFHSCESCTRSFINKNALKVHRAQNICKRKRKCTTEFRISCEPKQKNENENTNNKNDNLDENFNKNNKSDVSGMKPALPKQRKSQSSGSTKPLWLRELIGIAQKRHIRNNSDTDLICDESSFLKNYSDQFDNFVQTCCYCGRLLKTLEELLAHENKHKSHKEMPWIHFSQIKSEFNST